MTYSLDACATESNLDGSRLNLIVYVEINGTKDPTVLHFVWCGRQIAILANLKFMGLSGMLSRPLLF